MARILIVGCGCRGQALARELVGAGHAVRGTTRDPERGRQIEATGAQAFIADPDRVASLVPALDGVTIMCLLLGSTTGTHPQLKALHTTRLEMLLQRTIDTTVHGITYEATGSTDKKILATGANLFKAKCTFHGIPHRILTPQPNNWLTTTIEAVDALLTST